MDNEILIQNGSISSPIGEIDIHRFGMSRVVTPPIDISTAAGTRDSQFVSNSGMRIYRGSFVGVASESFDVDAVDSGSISVTLPSGSARTWTAQVGNLAINGNFKAPAGKLWVTGTWIGAIDTPTHPAGVTSGAVVLKNLLRGTIHVRAWVYGDGSGSIMCYVSGLNGSTAKKLVDANDAVKAVLTDFDGDTSLEGRTWSATFINPYEAFVRVSYRQKPLNDPILWRRRTGIRPVRTNFLWVNSGYIVTSVFNLKNGADAMMNLDEPCSTLLATVDKNIATIEADELNVGLLNDSVVTLDGQQRDPFTVRFMGIDVTPRYQNGAVVRRATYIYAWCPRGWEEEEPIKFYVAGGVPIPSYSYTPWTGHYYDVIFFAPGGFGVRLPTSRWVPGTYMPTKTIGTIPTP